jgi:hypothetical protein
MNTVPLAGGPLERCEWTCRPYMTRAAGALGLDAHADAGEVADLAPVEDVVRALDRDEVDAVEPWMAQRLARLRSPSSTRPPPMSRQSTAVSGVWSSTRPSTNTVPGVAA